MSKKPQYLTQNGFVRSGINPARDLINDLKKIRANDSIKKNNAPIPKLSPLVPLKSNIKLTNETEASPNKRKGISKEAAKAIAAAISGMLNSK